MVTPPLVESPQGYRNPVLGIEEFTTGGESHVDWITINEQPFLEIQVAVTP